MQVRDESDFIHKTKTHKSYNWTEPCFKNTSSFSSATQFRTMTHIRGLHSINILRKNIGNIRYPGLSEYQSMNTWQNSSHCWSFSKGNRFSEIRKDINNNIYNLPSGISKRSTSLGYGRRKDWREKCSSSPAPGAYTWKTEIENNILHHKGPKIAGKGKNEIERNKLYPGPGSFNVAKKTLIKNIPISLKSRISFFYDDEIKQKRHCVGMQKYHPNTKYQENLRFKTISFGLGRRTPTEIAGVKMNPGPGAYHIFGSFEKGLKKKLPIN